MTLYALLFNNNAISHYSFLHSVPQAVSPKLIRTFPTRRYIVSSFSESTFTWEMSHIKKVKGGCGHTVKTCFQWVKNPAV